MHHGSTSFHGEKCEEFESVWRFNFSHLPVTGDWLTQDSKLILYHNLVMEMVNYFEEINFKHLFHEENQMSDLLATLATMFQINSSDEVQLICMSIKEEPTHC